MPRGRPPKNKIIHELLKKAPKMNEDDRKEIDQFLKKSGNYYRQLRKQGFSDEFFEASEILDERHSGIKLSPQQKRMYEKILSIEVTKIEEKRNKNRMNLKKGNEAFIKSMAERNYLIKHQFADLIEQVKNGCSARASAIILKSRLYKDETFASDLWGSSDNIPTVDTFRKLLKKLALEDSSKK